MGLYRAAPDSDSVGNSENRTDCGIVCIHGCCTSGKCCDIQSSITIQVVSMLGSFVILVSVVLFCYVRYRCYHRHLQNMMARRQQDESTPGHAHYISGRSRPISVSTVQVPSLITSGHDWKIFQAQTLRTCFTSFSSSEIQPPPYTENDPLACPSSDRFFAAGLCSRVPPMVLPPAYSDVVKENENNGQNV
ncbi:uncharacterized protein LOC112571913 [Pomacea canaliculata]|uniref:uncharacterized protein LOC112571913 n=1 Tax=Pomacea canaliculata TaxID=400727 RepID=UPI000D731532|nr:uncharacterized protein LOC112571913 [Pomacea canaliculata]